MTSRRQGRHLAGRSQPSHVSAAKRAQQAKFRRRRLTLGLAVVALVVGLLVAFLPGSSPKTPSAGPPSTTTPSPATKGLPAIEAGLMPWTLAAPLSREVVLPIAGSPNVAVIGGLDGTGGSNSGVYLLDTKTGALHETGSLAQPTHDAAGAVIGGNALVLGGGAATVVATVERGPLGGSASIVASLPAGRADAAAVTIAGVAYVVGGYDGPSMEPEVLATTNGTSFRSVAKLTVPVRYPAVAALAGKIYVFGGLDSSGRPVDDVQVVDPVAGTARVVAHLSAAVAGATAGVLGGTVYVAGGTTAASGSPPTKAVYAFDATTKQLLHAGSLLVAVANAGAAVVGKHLFLVGGETSGATPSADVQVLMQNPAFGTAGERGAGSPFFGDKLLIADRGNNRLLLLDDTDKLIWSYPSKTKPPPVGGFYFPDDAFFIRHGTAIISNQEENDTIVEIAYPSGKVVFDTGHPRTPGSAPGYYNNPDDAYLLKDGDISVADAMNCRVLIIDPKTKRILHQIGTVGRCVHAPPNGVGSPNGDTPLSDGNLLVSEINGNWIDEYTTSGHLVWAVHLPINYVSDPQQLGPDRYLVADYSLPGGFVQFDRAGTILYHYAPSSGPGELNHPSLVEQLPSGVLMANDDYNDRMMAIDPGTGALVWQYGVTGTPGTRVGLLNTPDGFDILGPGGSTPTHLATG